jgi:ATP-dependent DNA helicase UvrD/PcrA
MDFLKDLNPQQLEAVRQAEGPLLILAGAGSGKTRVITYRIAYLIQNCGVSPYQILAVTFTNKAAEEMRARVGRLLGHRAQDVWISTFHSACVRILRQSANEGLGRLGYRPDFVIYDTADQQALIKDCLKELNIDEDLYEPRTVAARISGLKNAMIDSKEALDPRSFGLEAKVGRVYALYQEKLKTQNAMDFDDLLMMTVKLFETSPSLLELYQDRFRYILVDEYQDTNHAQYRLTKLLARKHRNLCVVGDDDQSIYSFRGADLKNILSFERDYPEAKVIALEQNYRSTQAILNGASAVVNRNRRRKPKKLWTENPPGHKLAVVQLMDEESEADYLCRMIQSGLAEGRTYRDFAVLYRTNAQSRVIEDAFRREGIPYLVVGGLRFYERKEIKDMLAYLRLLINPADSVSLKRIINVPARGIGSVTLEKIERHAGVKNRSLFEALSEVSGCVAETDSSSQEGVSLSPAAHRNIQKFVTMIRELQGRVNRLPLADLLQEVWGRTGYLEALKKDGGPEAESRIENLKELLTAMQEFQERSMETGDLATFLDQVALVSDTDNYSESIGAVALLTLHAAKGLEFPVVFLTGMEEGLFPYSKALTDEHEMEEERRLCYVGMTRAKENLHLTATQCRRIYGSTRWNSPSRFLEEIPAELVEFAGHKRVDQDYNNVYNNNNNDASVSSGFAVGSLVRHPQWGLGTVKKREGGGEDLRLTVSFASVGTKKLSVKYAMLEGASG